MNPPLAFAHADSVRVMLPVAGMTAYSRCVLSGSELALFQMQVCCCNKMATLTPNVSLKKGYVITTLSNGNVALLTNMAKSAGLPWDCVLSAELFHHYKPDPESYLGAAAMLGLEPHEVMMVAAHKSDLRAAQAAGLRAAFVARPLEYGPAVKKDLKAEKDFDVNAKDFEDLAAKLGL
jgi:beta-phosphoglucomutase-like phosphatase (HAD superfamily)